VLAGLVGIALGWLGVRLSARAVGSGQVMQAAPLLHFGRVVVVFVALVGVGLATAVLPALRAMRTHPAVALRAT
jgi:ABC-type antimicrobial peptide transport system permease subunit